MLFTVAGEEKPCSCCNYIIHFAEESQRDNYFQSLQGSLLSDAKRSRHSIPFNVQCVHCEYVLNDMRCVFYPLLSHRWESDLPLGGSCTVSLCSYWLHRNGGTGRKYLCHLRLPWHFLVDATSNCMLCNNKASLFMVWQNVPNLSFDSILYSERHILQTCKCITLLSGWDVELWVLQSIS